MNSDVATIAAFLSAIGDRTPYPGGGAAAAYAVAMGASLTCMVGRFSIVGADPVELVARSEHIAVLALELLGKDADSYAEVLGVDASRITMEPAAYREARRRALHQASLVPAEVTRLGAEVVKMALALTDVANRYLIGDAITAGLIAQGGALSAFGLVCENLAGTQDPLLEAAIGWSEEIEEAGVALRALLASRHASP